jgi:quercetin dioxygenase-like cupin family protein
MLHYDQNIRLTSTNQPVIIPPMKGELLQAHGISCQFKVAGEISNDQLGVYEIILQPGTVGAKLHFHKFTEETFVVLKGTLTIQSSHVTQEVGEGTVIQIPRLTPDAFSNTSTAETKILLVFSPGQRREGFFRELFPAIRDKALDTPAIRALNIRYDSFLVEIISQTNPKQINMNKYRTELKWAFIFAAMFLIWMTIERIAGLHSSKLDMQQIVTTFILVPSFVIYILALRDKKRNTYKGKITFKQSFVSGLWLTIFIVLLSPVNQIITTTIISPDYFSNLTEYTVRNGIMTQEQAQEQFTNVNYIIQSVIGGLITGLLFTTIISFFIKSKTTKSSTRKS